LTLSAAEKGCAIERLRFCSAAQAGRRLGLKSSHHFSGSRNPSLSRPRTIAPTCVPRNRAPWVGRLPSLLRFQKSPPRACHGIRALRADREGNVRSCSVTCVIRTCAVDPPTGVPFVGEGCLAMARWRCTGDRRRPRCLVDGVHLGPFRRRIHRSWGHQVGAKPDRGLLTFELMYVPE